MISRLAHISNVSPVQNKISSACDHKIVNASHNQDHYQDPFYGHAWTWTPHHGAAVYGKTEDLPLTPIDERGSRDFVRVPFRRVPIIDIHSIDELFDYVADSVSFDDSIQAVWRGQTSQYELKRGRDDKLRLYGDGDVFEPSLLPSAARSGVDFSEIFPTWSALLDVYLRERCEELERSHGTDISMDVERIRRTYRYRTWNMATAQHYGLPSVGLDVTDDITVAAFFALHSLRVDKSTRSTTVSRVDASHTPIIYGLGAFKGDLVKDEDVAPSWMQSVRAKAQSAYFMPTGWGASANKPAERIYVVYRLRNHEQWKLPAGVEELFPRTSDDSLAAFMRSAKTRFADRSSVDLLDRIYYSD